MVLHFEIIHTLWPMVPMPVQTDNSKANKWNEIKGKLALKKSQTLLWVAVSHCIGLCSYSKGIKLVGRSLRDEFPALAQFRSTTRGRHYLWPTPPAPWHSAETNLLLLAYGTGLWPNFGGSTLGHIVLRAICLPKASLHFQNPIQYTSYFSFLSVSFFVYFIFKTLTK